MKRIVSILLLFLLALLSAGAFAQTAPSSQTYVARIHAGNIIEDTEHRLVTQAMYDRILNLTGGGQAITFSNLPDKPAFFPSSISLVQNLQTVLDSKLSAGQVYTKTQVDNLLASVSGGGSGRKVLLLASATNSQLLTHGLATQYGYTSPVFTTTYYDATGRPDPNIYTLPVAGFPDMLRLVTPLKADGTYEVVSGQLVIFITQP